MNFRHLRRSTVRRAAGGLIAAAALAGAGAAFADPLATPAMGPTISGNPNPLSVDSGTPLGKIYFSGALTGIGMGTDNQIPGDRSSWLDLTNAQVIVQNTSGPIQFYVQAGEYAQPFLGLPYFKAADATRLNFGNVPVAYLKWQITPELSIQGGKLPTLIGSELVFTFENMNVFRGLLVAQEPAVSQGLQINYAKGPLTLSGSWNDGFYSGQMSWVSGAATWVFSPKDTVVVSGGGAVRKTSITKFTTSPVQNNGYIVDLIWTHTAGNWVISPYVQYTHNPENDDFGVYRPSSTWGVSAMAKYSFNSLFSMAGRVEYEQSHSDSCNPAVTLCAPTNVLFGPNSKAWSFTLTPTFQKGIFFLRGEVSYVLGQDVTPGFGFGSDLSKKDQTRALIETGVVF